MGEQSPYAALEARLGHRFRNPDLLQQALTHRSFVNEGAAGERLDNERLEFLGDAVLDLAISHFLMERYPDRSEGELTVSRASLVSEPSLADVALQIGLGEWLFLGRGEEQTGGRRKASLLADAWEAVVAAVYLDAGYETCARMVERLFEPLLEHLPEARRQDHKTRLQELAQAHFKQAPRYHLRGETGPDHDKRFTVGMSLAGRELAVGEGRSKKEAEQQAAQRALRVLEAELAAQDQQGDRTRDGQGQGGG